MRLIPTLTLTTLLILSWPTAPQAAEVLSPAGARVGVGGAMLTGGVLGMAAGGACFDGLVDGPCEMGLSAAPALFTPGIATLVAGMVQAEEAAAWDGDSAELALRHRLLSARILSPFYLLAGGILGGVGLSRSIGLAIDGEFPPGGPGLLVAAVPLSGFSMLTAGLVMTFEGEAELRRSGSPLGTNPGTYLMQGAGFLAISGLVVAVGHGFVHMVFNIFGGYYADPFAAAYLLATAYEITAIAMLVAGARRSEGLGPAPGWDPEPEPPFLIQAISPFHDARTGTTGLAVSGRFR